MAKKYDTISELYERTAKEVTATPENWQSFLSTACHNYKLRMDEQLLVYAQRPDATAILEIERWNRRFGRWVNPGAHGIAVFEEAGRSRQRLVHYFDISDTHESRRNIKAQPVPLWTMQEAYKTDVIASLEHSFGGTENTDSLIEAVFSATNNAVEDNIQDYLPDFRDCIEGSFLEGLDDLNLSKIFKDCVTSSTVYMVLSRLGIEPAPYLEADAFKDIVNFSTVHSLNALGTTVRDIAGLELSEISRTVLSIENQEKAIALKRESEYTVIENKSERSSENEQSDLQQAGGLLSAEPDPAEAAGGRTGLLRTAAQEIYSGEAPDTVYESSDGRETDGLSVRSGTESIENGGQPYSSDGSTGRSDRGIESEGYDELDEADEQYPEQSAGDSPGGADLQLIKKLPSFQEQQNIIAEAEAKTASAFSISQDEIDTILCRGSGYSRGKYRIYEHYLKGETVNENAVYLKNEYGIGGTYPAIPNTKIDLSYSGKGLSISKGNLLNPDSHVNISWNQAAKRIKTLIDTGRYMTAAELEGYSAYREELNLRALRTRVSQEFRSIVYDYNAFLEETGEKDKQLNLWLMSGCWTGFSAGEKKTFTRDTKGEFILPIMRDSMNKIISENTYLTRRCEDVMVSLNGELAKPFEPSFDELNPPPPPKMELRFSLGDAVYIGTGKYEILSMSDDTVVLYDSQFPLFNKEMPRAEFDAKAAENPLNDKYKIVVKEQDELEGSDFWNPYNDIKEHNPERIVLYQVDEDFEIYGEDAVSASKALQLSLGTRDIPGAGTVSVCVLPGKYLDTYKYMLTDRGYDLVISEYWDGERYNYETDSVTKDKPLESFPIGRIEYLGADGTVGESNEYLYPKDFEEDIKDRANSGAPINVYVYKDRSGHSIPHSFVFELDPPPKHFEVVDNPFITQPDLMEQAKNIIEEFYRKEFNDDKEADLSDLSSVEIAYTTTEDEQHEIQVTANLTDFRLETYADDVLIRTEQYSDLSDLINNGLRDMSFDELTAVNNEEILWAHGIEIHENEEYNSIEFSFREKPDAAVRDVLKENRFRWNTKRQGWYGYGDRNELADKLLAAYDDSQLEEFLNFDAAAVKAELERRAESGEHSFVDGVLADTERIAAESEKPDPDEHLTDERITTPRGSFYFTSLSEDEMREAGYGVHHISDDGKYLIMGNGTRAFAVSAEPLKELNKAAKKAIGSFEIYQLRNDDSTRDLRFEPYERLISTGHSVNRENYELMYTDELLSGTTLENIYARFNIERPEDFKGHSLSVSDIVVLKSDGIETAHYVDSVGFAAVPEFLKEKSPELSPKPADAPLAPAWTQKRSRVASYDLHPDVPSSERINFNLSLHPVEEAGKKERFRRNIAAIQLLKKCEKEKRFASADEQLVLSKYVGWGGISEAFDANNPSWTTEYMELKSVLDEDEYTAARESTLTAFYTPPAVIQAVYKTLENMGFEEGNILEPACGIGNFMGLLPESMGKSRMYGVELDSISAQISQQLYQKNSIAAAGFEDVDLPDSFFDAIVGNVPFGDFKVSDRKYDKYNFLIHDFFFAKSLDKLRPGGVMALVTSKGTMDKENPSVRKYIAQRAELLGAVRLPNDTFKGNAGTEVVSDILFLKKRDRIIDLEPDWVHLGLDENGRKMNQYFADHPEMVLGEWKTVSGRFGNEDTVVPYENTELKDLLAEAITSIHGEISSYELDEDIEQDEDVIPADPRVKNFSYTILEDKIYYRENSVMTPPVLTKTSENRIRGMIELRDCVRELIEFQTENYPDEDIAAQQTKLNSLYDNYTKKYGLINDRANRTAFSQDSSYSLLLALEILDEEGKLERKADMFEKRTIKPHIPVTEVDSASEAFALSMGEKAHVDMDYMCALTGRSEDEVYEDLKGVIFLNPMYGKGVSEEAKYLPADEYLSGNVRKKLLWAKQSAAIEPEKYSVNVEALEKVQPKDLSASEISVRLGATWIPPEIVEQFIFTFLNTPVYAQWNIHVHYSPYNGEWNIEGKSNDRANLNVYSTYGTDRMNAYKIIEETLNLKDVRIFDYIEDMDGHRKAVLNKKETAIAQSKQELIQQGFKDWIWSDPQRREKLCRYYNDKFNAIRPREYDGSHIEFYGMNPEIQLREHQKNAVAHILYGGNTLLAHCVGAGKTFEMVAAAMESKRLGLCSKSLFVVPNHLTEQWAAEFLQLYPSANILVATRKDFETKNRKRFCARIATGDYDAVIIGHSQFEKIPISIERQRSILEQQLEEVLNGIAELKQNRGDNFSVKQLEKTKKNLKLKLDKLNDQRRKDDVVTFEELGVDRLFVDESHYYKNLFLYTKMRNVGGIAQTEAQKSSDLFNKCRYLDELTGGRGIVFATGTPISNSMVELYTIQRYLQYDTLKAYGLQNFDAWASTFGETITAVELTPEGSGYRAKTRFARFYNCPELMAMFKGAADIQTSDMLKLPVPEAHYHNVAVKPSEIQKDLVASLSDRADKVRNGMVNSTQDNMLLITNDGRKLALDQRLINPMLPDFEGSKVNACVENVFKIWQDTAEKRSAQLIFCDLSTPKSDGSFSVYTDIRKKLIERGIPEDEIKFIHEADSEVKKTELFKKVRKGEVRVLMGSTQKMGAGTNCQDKLIALHDIECPWRPSDLEQRSGRIIRQGNENKEVDIYRYVTEETFDAYLYQLVEGKQKFASQIMTSKSPVRSVEDIDETALSYAEIKMLATGNPNIKEKMDLDIQVQKLRLLKANYLTEKYALEDKIYKDYPAEIARVSAAIKGLEKDVLCVEQHPKSAPGSFVGIEIMGKYYSEKADAGETIIQACQTLKSADPVHLGQYRGFQMDLFFSQLDRSFGIKFKGNLSCPVLIGADPLGNITRMDNALDGISKRLELTKSQLSNLNTQLETAKENVNKPFSREDELSSKTARLSELNALLNVDKNENEIIEAQAEEIDAPERERGLER